MRVSNPHFGIRLLIEYMKKNLLSNLKLMKQCIKIYKRKHGRNNEQGYEDALNSFF